MASTTGRTYTLDEVAKHNKDGDCWVVVDGLVLGTLLCCHPCSPTPALSPLLPPRCAHTDTLVALTGETLTGALGGGG
jgi:hypothetical protein